MNLFDKRLVGGPELDFEFKPFDFPINLPAPASRPKKGFFKKGGGFWDILGYIGDGLAGNDRFANHKAEQRRRAVEWEEWKRRQEWLAAHQPYGGPPPYVDRNYP